MSDEKYPTLEEFSCVCSAECQAHIGFEVDETTLLIQIYNHAENYDPDEGPQEGKEFHGIRMSLEDLEELIEKLPEMRKALIMEQLYLGYTEIEDISQESHGTCPFCGAAGAV